MPRESPDRAAPLVLRPPRDAQLPARKSGKEPDMFGTQDLAVFVTAGLLLNVTPGQDTMYIVGRSLAQGRRAGVVSALGIGTGSLVHTVAAAAGVAALLAASPLAFGAIRWAGAAYLVYLGLRMLFAAPP